jgi:hypothetical protein
LAQETLSSFKEPKLDSLPMNYGKCGLLAGVTDHLGTGKIRLKPHVERGCNLMELIEDADVEKWEL